MSFINDAEDFYINSKNRLSGTHSNFTYKIDNPNNRYTHCALLSATVPKSYYLIQDNEVFILSEDGQDTLLDFPKGFYTYIDFKNTLQNILNLSSPNGWIYTITYVKRTGHFIFTVINNGILQPSFGFAGYLYQQMGFLDNKEYTFINDSLESVAVVNMSVENNIFIRSSLVENKRDNIIATLNGSSTPPLGLIGFQNNDIEGSTQELTLINQDVHYFHITDENGREINLNEQNCTMTIRLYKKDNIYDKIRDVIRLSLIEDSS